MTPQAAALRYTLPAYGKYAVSELIGQWLQGLTWPLRSARCDCAAKSLPYALRRAPGWGWDRVLPGAFRHVDALRQTRGRIRTSHSVRASLLHQFTGDSGPHPAGRPRGGHPAPLGS